MTDKPKKKGRPVTGKALSPAQRQAKRRAKLKQAGLCPTCHQPLPLKPPHASEPRD